MTILASRSPGWWRIAVGLLTAIAIAHPAAAERKNPKFDAALQEAVKHGQKTVTVIIQVDGSVRGQLKRALVAQGLPVPREHGVISALTLEVPVKLLDKLADMPGVISVSIDAPVGSNQAVVPTTNGDMLRDDLGIPSSGYEGTGVGVAVIDSGIAPLGTFGNRIRAFYDFTTGVALAQSPHDEYGHGSHVAATIAGSGSPYGSAYQGVAPSVSLIGLRVLDNDGKGATSNVIAAIEFAVANRTALDIDIINLSLGHAPFESATTDPLVKAVNQAVAAGIVVVVSAGNVGINPQTGLVGYGGITVPGNARSAITIGASQTMGTVSRFDDTIGPYSSRGPTWTDG